MRVGVTLLAIFCSAWPAQAASPEAMLAAAEQPAATSPADELSTPLLRLHDADGRSRAIQTPQDWRLRRQQILAAMQLVMGPLPARPAQPVTATVVEQTQDEDVTRFKLSLTVAPDDHVPAYLLVPQSLRDDTRRRAPAMLALHQTVRIGKAEPVGLGVKPNLRYGIELARRGYIVLAPDYPSFGDYPFDFKASGLASGTIKGVFNHMRCVDYLCSRPEVDPGRIGVIGHSLGGHNAIFVGAFDERLQVVVSSCGWTRFHTYYGGDLKGWTSERYMPRIRDVYGNDPDRLPIEFEEIIAALAPRAFFSVSPLRDDNFDVAGVHAAMEMVRPVYALLDARDRLKAVHPDCGHDFPPEARREAYRFIDAVLRHTPIRQLP